MAVHRHIKLTPMASTPSQPHLLRTVARLSGGLVLAFLLFMVIAHLVPGAEGPDGLSFRSTSEGLQFMLFPICTMLGLALAFRWELFGALVVMVSMALLCMLRPDLLRTAFLLWGSPAVLYLAHWATTRDREGA
jgi:hypothetical protein